MANEDVRGEWFVFYYHNGTPDASVDMSRIGASCLGDAIETAIQMAKRCNLCLIGVCEDIGVSKE